MLNLENLSVADNTIAISGVVVGVVTDDVAQKILALVGAQAQAPKRAKAAVPEASPKVTAKSKSTTSPKGKSKAPVGDSEAIVWKHIGAVKGLGYVVTTKTPSGDDIPTDQWKTIAQDLKSKRDASGKKSLAWYSRHYRGFVFQTKGAAEKYIAEQTVAPIKK